MDEAPEGSETPEVPRNSTWRGYRKSTTRPLSAEAARRQGEITNLAFSLLGGREAAMAFLNEPDDSVGGRPLEVATASPDGFERVESLIRNHPPREPMR